MTEAIVWKYATESEVARLATQHSVDDCKRSLAEMFGLNLSDEMHGFLLDLHLHNYSFCRQKHFQLNQTSVFLGICQTLMKCDFARDSTTTFKHSFELFQSMLLTHSVNRSPKSVCIFSRDEVAEIVDYVTNSYYRHFQLYKNIFTPYKHVYLVQREINDVQIPKTPHLLSQAFLHTVKHVTSAKKPEEYGMESPIKTSEPPKLHEKK